MKTLYTLLALTWFSIHSYPSFSKSSEQDSFQNLYVNEDSTNIPLAVILLDFQARLESEESVKLHWITASEKDIDVFIIERSTDGIQFEALAQMKGTSNSSHLLQYTFTDTILSYSQAYYRLKQVDLQGSVSYSKVVEASYKPNPLTVKF
jgi:hypothetical protein